MANFTAVYESNLEVGQFIQKCDCADALVSTVSEKDKQQRIPFTASLSNMYNESFIEKNGYVDYWQIQKHRIRTYRLKVTPKIGAIHHDYRDIVPAKGSFSSNIYFKGNMTAFVNVEVSRKESVIYDIPYDFKILDDGFASSEKPFIESAFLAAITNKFK